VADASPGSVANVRLIGEAAAGSLQVTVNDRPAALLGLAGGILSFRMPAGLAAGPGVIRVTSGGESAAIGITIDGAPPAIASLTAAGTRIDESRPARPGEVLTLNVAGLADAAADVGPGRVTVLVNKTAQTILGVTIAGGAGHNVLFQLDPGTPNGIYPLMVAIDGRASAEFTLPVRTN
jgi:uncharacterized protein (TIGR03437 family)